MKIIACLMSAAILTVQAYDFPKESYSLPLKQEIEKKPKADPSFAYYSYNPALYALFPAATGASIVEMSRTRIYSGVGMFRSRRNPGVYPGLAMLSGGLTALAYIFPHGIGYRKFYGPLAIDLGAHFYYLSGSIGVYIYTHPHKASSFYFGVRESISAISIQYSNGMSQYSKKYSLSFPPPLIFGFQRNKDRKQFFQCSIYLDKYISPSRSNIDFEFYSDIGKPLLALEYGKSF